MSYFKKQLERIDNVFKVWRPISSDDIREYTHNAYRDRRTPLFLVPNSSHLEQNDATVGVSTVSYSRMNFGPARETKVI